MSARPHGAQGAAAAALATPLGQLAYAVSAFGKLDRLEATPLRFPYTLLSVIGRECVGGVVTRNTVVCLVRQVRADEHALTLFEKDAVRAFQADFEEALHDARNGVRVADRQPLGRVERVTLTLRGGAGQLLQHVGRVFGVRLAGADEGPLDPVFAAVLEARSRQLASG